jgi:hypothetical protein
MALSETIKPRPDPVALALAALAWTMAEPARARRLLDVTGLEPETLRSRASDPALLAAVLGFLEAYEPDLIACAAALEVPADQLVTAHRELER